MSRSRRKRKKRKVLEPGCPLCDPSVAVQWMHENRARDDRTYVRESIIEATAVIPEAVPQSGEEP